MRELFVDNFAGGGGASTGIEIAIKTAKSKLQREAKQQNCLAKTHCYWLVLKKIR